MFKGVSNWAPYCQFHFEEGGGFQIGHPIGSFILGREGWVHLQVDRKSVRFMDSDWLSTLPRADSCAKKENINLQYKKYIRVCTIKYILMYYILYSTMYFIVLMYHLHSTLDVHSQNDWTCFAEHKLNPLQCHLPAELV